MLLLAATIGLAACESPASHPGALIWGEANAVLAPARDQTPVVVETVRLEPRGASGTRGGVEAALARSLEFRRVAVSDRSPLTLRYAWHMVPVDADAEGLGVLLDGSIGESGSNDLGIGLDLGLLSGGSKVRHSAFVLELSLADANGEEMWRGRADGRSRAKEPARILRALVPVLLDYLGQAATNRRFSR